MLRADRRGLEGLPLKLVITSLVIALSVPPLYSSLEFLEFTTRLRSTLEEAEDIKQAALSAYIGGPGNVRIVHLSLDEGGIGWAQIMLGGKEGTVGASAIHILWKGAHATTLRLDDPSFGIVTPEGVPLVLEGNADLRLTCLTGEKDDVILVEVV